MGRKNKGIDGLFAEDARFIRISLSDVPIPAEGETTKKLPTPPATRTLGHWQIAVEPLVRALQILCFHLHQRVFRK
jgi:hypothetical protein